MHIGQDYTIYTCSLLTVNLLKTNKKVSIYNACFYINYKNKYAPNSFGRHLFRNDFDVNLQDMLRSKKPRAQAGFPLLFVFVVSLVSLYLGYLLHSWVCLPRYVYICATAVSCQYSCKTWAGYDIASHLALFWIYMRIVVTNDGKLEMVFLVIWCFHFMIVII